MSTSTLAEIGLQTIEVIRRIDIAAPLEITFKAVLDEVGPAGVLPDGTPFPRVLEAWPGGRWYRDLGSNAGHLWGHVQVIKPPGLLELCGPMFLSHPCANHIQYRLTPHGEGTRLQFAHRGFGHIPAEILQRVSEGWGHHLDRIVALAHEQARRQA